MPRPDGGGGPFIGDGLKRWIADEAIKADLGHRGFFSQGEEGVFRGEGHDGSDRNITVWWVFVSDGSVEITIPYGNRENPAIPDPSDYAYLQTDVFDYWRTAIDEAFSGWDDMTESTALTYDAHSVIRGAREIQLNAATSGGSSAGTNPRLKADLNALKDRTGKLNGHYAEAFFEGYVAGLEGVIDNLNSMTQVLSFALAAEAEVFDKTRDQVADIALKATDAMAASGPRSGGDLTALKVLLIVTGAAAAGVATLATSGTALAVGASLTSAGAGAFNGLLATLVKPAKKAPELPLGADTPQGVLAKIKDALNDTNTAIKAEEQKIENLLVAGNQAASAAKGNHFDISRPGIIDHHGSSVLSGDQELVVDDEMIAKITKLWIPTINGDVKACAAGLTGTAGSWARPVNIGLGANGCWSAYSALQSSVEERLLDLVREMEGAADSLQEAAKIIGLSDQQTNKAFAEKAKRINDQDIDTI